MRVREGTREIGAQYAKSGFYSGCDCRRRSKRDDNGIYYSIAGISSQNVF